MSVEKRQPRELPAGLIRHIYLSNALIPTIGAIAVWLLWIVYVAFGFDLIGTIQEWRHPQRGVREPGNESTMYLVIAIGGTILAGGASFFRMRRALHLARYGVEVDTNTFRVSDIAVKGIVRVTYTYLFAAQSYEGVMNCSTASDKEEIEAYRQGTRSLVLLVDPDNPSVAMKKSDVLPVSIGVT